jgi:hypothetical protein
VNAPYIIEANDAEGQEAALAFSLKLYGVAAGVSHEGVVSLRWHKARAIVCREMALCFERDFGTGRSRRGTSEIWEALEFEVDDEEQGLVACEAFMACCLAADAA